MVLAGPEDPEQGHRSAEGHRDQERGWAFPCSGEEEEQGGREYLLQSCSVIGPSSSARESCQWGSPASG